MPKVPAQRVSAGELARLRQEEIWTVREAAQFLRVGEGLIRSGIHRGAIPCIRAGTWMRIPRRRFLEAIEAGALVADEPAAEAEIVRLPE